MTIATEVASLVGIAPSSCRRIAVGAFRRYKIFFVPKRRTGALRQIAQPAVEVKAIQRAIVEVLTPRLPVHESATAYKLGSSILDNARRHERSRFITKLDFSNFFPSIDASAVAYHLRFHIQDIVDSDVQFILNACLWRHEGPHALCIGAPSSPLLSNVVMFIFDREITEYCRAVGVVYTRYSDDITISSDEPNILSGVEKFIRNVCRGSVHPKLLLNEDKRVAVGRGTGMYVTGLTLANQGFVTVGRKRKRGVRSGIKRFMSGEFSADEFERLKGEVAFVLSIEPGFRRVLIRTYGPAIAPLLPRQDGGRN